MAIRQFSLSSIMNGEFSSPDWPRKSKNEAIQFIISAEPWMPYFSQTRGELMELNSHDGRDDPPDIEAKFRGGRLAFEMTHLLPERLGRYEAWLKESKLEQRANMLNLSSPTTMNPDEMLAYALSQGKEKWADVDTEFKLWQQEARSHFERKARASGYDYVIMHASPRNMANFLLVPLVRFLNELLQSGPSSQPGFLISSTCWGYNTSWLLEKNRAMERRESNKSYTRVRVEKLKPGEKLATSIFTKLP